MSKCNDESKCITNGELTLCGCFMVKQEELESLKTKLIATQGQLRGAWLEVEREKERADQAAAAVDKLRPRARRLAYALDLFVEYCKRSKIVDSDRSLNSYLITGAIALEDADALRWQAKHDEGIIAKAKAEEAEFIGSELGKHSNEELWPSGDWCFKRAREYRS